MARVFGLGWRVKTSLLQGLTLKRARMESKLQRPMEQCNIIVETSRKCMINVIILGSYLVLLLCEEAKEWRFFMLSSCRWVEHEVVRHRTCSYHSNIYIMRMVNSSVYATCDHRKVFRNMISVAKGDGLKFLQLPIVISSFVRWNAGVYH